MDPSPALHQAATIYTGLALTWKGGKFSTSVWYLEWGHIWKPLAYLGTAKCYHPLWKKRAINSFLGKGIIAFLCWFSRQQWFSIYKSYPEAIMERGAAGPKYFVYHIPYADKIKSEIVEV